MLCTIDVSKPEDFLQSLILIWLSNAAALISVAALGAILFTMLRCFSVLRGAAIIPYNLSDILEAIQVLATINHGTRLIDLASEILTEEVINKRSI